MLVERNWLRLSYTLRSTRAENAFLMCSCHVECHDCHGSGFPYWISTGLMDRGKMKNSLFESM
ncbi:hypothetical protein ABTN51_20255, partial [Acinetobacter baumannii]